MKIVIFLLLLLLLHPSSASFIYGINVDDVITHGTAEEIKNGIMEAERDGASAFLIILNTPGGLVDATEDIILAIEESGIPVITWVPIGARAYSAGSFILLAGHLACMANGTATGAATPVSFTGTGIEAVEKKIINAFAARMRGIAEKRGRNVTAAELFVTEGKSMTAREALSAGLIDLMADTKEELLSKAGFEGKIIIKEKSVRTKIMDLLGNPQVAFILLLIGIYGIIFGLASPGTYVPETIGAICLILALYGMGVFSANALGILLMIGGILLLLAEALTPGVGIFLTGGILCIILGALFLPPAPSPPSGFFVSHEWWTAFLLTILAAGIAGSAFFAFALGKAIKLRRRKATTGTEELLGMTGKADTDIAPEGRIRVRGELWNARIERGGETIKRGEDAKIINREGLTLIVRKKGGDKNGI